MIGPCWMQDHEKGCQYWVGPHVITAETWDFGSGRWVDEEGEHYCPPTPGVPICENPYKVGAVTLSAAVLFSAFNGAQLVATWWVSYDLTWDPAYWPAPAGEAYYWKWYNTAKTILPQQWVSAAGLGARQAGADRICAQVVSGFVGQEHKLFCYNGVTLSQSVATSTPVTYTPPHKKPTGLKATKKKSKPLPFPFMTRIGQSTTELPAFQKPAVTTRLRKIIRRA